MGYSSRAGLRTPPTERQSVAAREKILLMADCVEKGGSCDAETSMIQSV